MNYECQNAAILILSKKLPQSRKLQNPGDINLTSKVINLKYYKHLAAHDSL